MRQNVPAPAAADLVSVLGSTVTETWFPTLTDDFGVI